VYYNPHERERGTIQQCTKDNLKTLVVIDILLLCTKLHNKKPIIKCIHDPLSFAYASRRQSLSFSFDCNPRQTGNLYISSKYFLTSNSAGLSLSLSFSLSLSLSLFLLLAPMGLLCGAPEKRLPASKCD
jgi:hypothetical protein